MNQQTSCTFPGTSTVLKLAVTPSHVIAAATDGTILILDLDCKHKDLPDCDHKSIFEVGNILDVDCHNRYLAIGGFGGIARLWDLKTGTELKAFPSHGNPVWPVHLPDASTLITGAGKEIHSLRVWNLLSGTCRYKIDDFGDRITAIETDGGRIVVASRDQTVRVYDLGTGNQLYRTDGLAKVPAFMVSQDGARLVVNRSGGGFEILEFRNFTVLGQSNGFNAIITSFFNRDNHLITISADGSIHFWDWKDGTMVKAIENAHSVTDQRSAPAIRNILWTKNLMITGGIHDGLLKVWNAEHLTFVSQRRLGRGLRHMADNTEKVAVVHWSGYQTSRLVVWDKKEIKAQGI